MTTYEAQVVVDQIDAEDGDQAGDPATLSCTSYTMARYLAASRRREGTDAYAVYDVALGCWCVKEEVLPIEHPCDGAIAPTQWRMQ